MSSVQFPDLTYGNRPADGEYFYHGGIYYKWDNALGKWTDPSGAFWAPSYGASAAPWNVGTPLDPAQQYYSSSHGRITLPEGYTPISWQTDGGGEAIKTATEEKSSGDKLKTFFFGDNSGGCECGAWTVGSPGHSSFCKLYR